MGWKGWDLIRSVFFFLETSSSWKQNQILLSQCRFGEPIFATLGKKNSAQSRIYFMVFGSCYSAVNKVLSNYSGSNIFTRRNAEIARFCYNRSIYLWYEYMNNNRWYEDDVVMLLHRVLLALISYERCMIHEYGIGQK